MKVSEKVSPARSCVVRPLRNVVISVLVVYM